MTPPLHRALPGLLVLFAFLPGCGRKPFTPPESPTPVVSISQPVQRAVIDHVDFTGRTDAVLSTDIRSRVTGYLIDMPFAEGAPVKKGDLLFQIDDRPYQADLDKAKADVERQKAALVKTQANLDIGLETAKLNPGAISKQELNRRQGERDEAAATLDSAKATLARSQLNFDWCKVTSPTDGQISRYYLTKGNLATQDTTLLTTVVSYDPTYAYFDVDEPTMLRVLRTILPSKEDPLRTRKFPVSLGLADEQGYPHLGHVDFANNKVDPLTGTITVRGVFDNPPMPSGRRLLRPGMFVRIRLPLGKDHPALLVSESALGTDQGQKYLLVLDDKKVVQYRRVEVGPLQEDGLRVIAKGIEATDWVIVNGTQLVRPRMQVEAEKVPMPTAGGADKP